MNCLDQLLRGCGPVDVSALCAVLAMGLGALATAIGSRFEQIRTRRQSQRESMRRQELNAVINISTYRG